MMKFRTKFLHIITVAAVLPLFSALAWDAPDANAVKSVVTFPGNLSDILVGANAQQAANVVLDVFDEVDDSTAATSDQKRLSQALVIGVAVNAMGNKAPAMMKIILETVSAELGRLSVAAAVQTLGDGASAFSSALVSLLGSDSVLGQMLSGIAGNASVVASILGPTIIDALGKLPGGGGTGAGVGAGVSIPLVGGY